MKNMHWLCVILIISLSACRQKIKEIHVPAAVKKTFTDHYPGVTANWEKDGNDYEINFRRANNMMSVTINKTGSILETETGITITDLPENVKSYIHAHYGDNAIKDASFIEKANGEKLYEAGIKGRDIMFDSIGNFIREEKE